MFTRIVTLVFSTVLVALAVGDYFSETVSPHLTFEILTAFAIAIGVLLIPDVEELSIKDIFHFKRRVKIEPATDEEAINATQEDLEADETSQEGEKKVTSRDIKERAAAFQVLERRAISVLTSQWPQDAHVSMDAVKLELPEPDPTLGRSKIVFDGYINWRGVEQFIEVKRASVHIPFLRQQISRQLVAIRKYAKSQKIEAKLKLVLIFLPGEHEEIENDGILDIRQRRAQKTLKRLRYEFSDAIEDGMLEIVPFHFSQKDLDSLGVTIQ